MNSSLALRFSTCEPTERARARSPIYESGAISHSATAPGLVYNWGDKSGGALRRPPISALPRRALLPSRKVNSNARLAF